MLGLEQSLELAWNPVDAVRRAVIDVGTNSVKLLVAEISGREVQPVWEESRQTRLGKGFYETRRLQPEPIAKTAQAVADFAAKAQELEARSIRVIATSAARDALNSQELTRAIEQASGLKVEVISGEQEAHWAFEGATTDASLAEEPLLLLDVGGGSSEFILGFGAEKHFSHSFELGAVRLLEKIRPADPPSAQQLAACRAWVREFLRREVQPQLQPALQRLRATQPAKPIQLVGTGGTASILGRMEAGLLTYDRQQIEAARLSCRRLTDQVQRLWSLTLDQRMQVPGLPKNRADVILTGTAIYEGILDLFGFAQLRISTRGLRFAAVRAE